jgi:hypothetical protein
MSKPLRPATLRDAEVLVDCEEYLRNARIHARNAGAPRLVAKISSTLKSCEGARRHLERCLAHARKTH